MKSYSSYKETSIPWLEKIPSHWDTMRAKMLYKKENRQPLPDDEVVTCFRDGVVTLRKNRRLTGFTEAIKEHGYQHIEKGDLVIHVMDAFAGSVGVSDSAGKATPVYSVCTSKLDINNFFYAYIIKEMAKSGFISSLYRGIRERSSDFRFEVFAKQMLPVPPRSEQDRIVSFLDDKISKIDLLIESKKKQIELLKEHKQAAINKVVTKGVNDDVPMKDSCIEWLGNIPKHWTLSRLSKYLKEKSVKNKPDLPLLSVVRDLGVIQRDITSRDENHNYIPDELHGYKAIDENNFVINKMKAWQGSYGISKYSGIVSPAYYTFDVNFSNVNYFHYVTRSRFYINFFAQASDGVRVGQWDLSKRKMKNIPFLVPPQHEQNEIIEFISNMTAKTDLSINSIKREIELISEYKESLISSIVTGRVDISSDAK